MIVNAVSLKCLFASVVPNWTCCRTRTITGNVWHQRLSSVHNSAGWKRVHVGFCHLRKRASAVRSGYLLLSYIWLMILGAPSQRCVFACHISTSYGTVILAASLISRIAAIAADTIALVVAWIKAVDVVREASRRRVEVPLGDVLIRDGKHTSHYDCVYVLSTHNHS